MKVLLEYPRLCNSGIFHCLNNENPLKVHKSDTLNTVFNEISNMLEIRAFLSIINIWHSPSVRTFLPPISNLNRHTGVILIIMFYDDIFDITIGLIYLMCLYCRLSKHKQLIQVGV